MCKGQVEWAKTEKRTFLRQRIELRLASLYMQVGRGGESGAGKEVAGGRLKDEGGAVRCDSGRKWRVRGASMGWGTVWVESCGCWAGSCAVHRRRCEEGEGWGVGCRVAVPGQQRTDQRGTSTSTSTNAGGSAGCADLGAARGRVLRT